ncbi:hypothetical protein MKX01_025601 [Papaver californicum]|nr:hypothetical protein MKX01_025601 [Papaver californicum]
MVLQKSKSGDISIFLQDEIVVEILSRLPVRTLMRFKCVCKPWLSLIKHDSYFIDLHFTRSKLRPCCTLAIPRITYSYPSEGNYNLLIADLSETGRIAVGATPILHSVRKAVSLNYDVILKPVNGLICFRSIWPDIGICVYNLSTRELSPWIRTPSPIEKTNVFHSRTYRFGFDPTTKEHKVICMWNDRFGDSDYVATQVMTVGTNTWRLIDEVLPKHIQDLEETSVCANGSIYWITYDLFYSRVISERKILIVAFDVGSEKFRTVLVPKFMTDQLGDDSKHVTQLLDVNDCVALSCISPQGNTAKLWILDDKENTNSSTTTNWREVGFHGIAGTDGILLETYHDWKDMKHVSLYSYNWKTKAFTQVTTGNLYSSVHESARLSAYYTKAFLCETFTESLLHV